MSTLAPAAAGFDNGRRGRFNAWFFTAFDDYLAHIARRHKEAAFGDLEPGDIVEIGAGVGANFDYLPAGSRLIAIEPNHAMHAGLRRRAERSAIELDIVTASAAHIPLPDASVDDVLCSLVLCTVEDQEAVLAEVRRILRPGGRLRVVEHVAAPPWSPRRWLQQVVRRPWRWLYEGCDTCRDTTGTIERAGFATVELHRGHWRRSIFLPVNTSIHGIAVN
jgi:ubiquinone/menaquinone biosynthesis C-methylase UbiE